MSEKNSEGYNFMPMTLFNFFPSNKKFKLSKKITNINSKKDKRIFVKNERLNNLNKEIKKLINNKLSPNSKNIKSNNIIYSTSNNFFNHNDKFSKKFSFNNYKYSFRTTSQNKKKIKESYKDKKEERIKSLGEVTFNENININNKELNERFLEQFLNNYDSKMKKNIKDMKATFTNNYNNIYKNSIKESNKNPLIKSLSNNYNINENDYLNYLKQNNKDKFNNFLPYVYSSSKEKKSSPKTYKQLLIFGNNNFNKINKGFIPSKENSDNKNRNKIFNNVLTFTKINDSNENNKKIIFRPINTNPDFNSLNNNTNTNSNISNTGNNNIIFNNMGSVNTNNNEGESSKKNIEFDKMYRTNTVEIDWGKDYNKFSKKNSNNNTLYEIKRDEINKTSDINDNIREDINEYRKKDNHIIIYNINNINNEKDKDTINQNNNRARALSTDPYSNKNSKKTTINIDCINENREKKESNDNFNSIKNQNYIDYFTENINDKNKKEKLLKYKIGNSLGKGAYAVVKLVTNRKTHEKFAMKIYEKEKLTTNSKKSCVCNEIQILKKLKHKNIVKLIEVITTERQILIIQELIEGISLREYYNNQIKHQKGISIHKANIFKTIFKQIFEAMNYLHKQGIAHRDIKLENILIKKNYEIKIIDFGFGMYNPENKLQKFFCGTPNYMPPEIAEKKPYIGQLADMWSLGVLLFKIFCADFPFKGKDEKDLYKSIKAGKFTFANYTPEYARKIICSLIVLDPKKRNTCEDVLKSEWLNGR